MGSLFTAISFQSPPSFNLQPPPPQCHHRRQHNNVSTKWGARHGLSLKPTPRLNASSRGGNNTTFPPSPLTDVIEEFYSSLNDKDVTRLDKLVTPDCTVEDTAHYKPLDVKNTRAYFRRLMEAMGKNVKFAIDEVAQGVEPTAAVMWHLEWKGKIIPFSKGCSFYICSANGVALLIRKVHIFDESPLKPGKLALEILHFVTNLFDTFPKIAEGFLKNPDAILQPFLRFFKFFLEPIVIPVLAYYTRFWTYVARALTMVLNILYNIFKRIA